MITMKLTIVLSLFLGALAQWDPNNVSGRHTAVHLFEWKWPDIAAECERFLGPYGFGAVQISPASEHRVAWGRPWWERYQPVSYQLQTRSGNEAEFRDMVKRCNNAGVRIYVDAVFNHMAEGSGYGTAGSSYNGLDFPGIYSAFDFNDAKCHTASGGIENYNDADQVRNCKLQGLADLNQGSEYVRGKISEYLNKLIDVGVAGFRVDACKHMWPGDLGAIVNRLHDLSTEYFPSNTRPFFVQEVIDVGAGEPITSDQYQHVGRVTEFKYSKFIGEVFRKWNNQKLSYFSNWGEGWGMLPSGSSFVFVDNHDNQRGHGAGGASVITFRDSKLYKMANAFMMAHPYGYTRLMSSYYFDSHSTDQGPPSTNENINGVTINSDGTCGGDWICEHRWRQIRNMVQFRNVVSGQSLQNWWSNGNNQIAFSRGNKGFIVINNDDWNMNEWLQTGMPSGDYCDVISGDKHSGHCTGATITVGGDGRAHFHISNHADDGVIAIHQESKL
ncbi:alpha-amylase 1-like [Branchiostoma lanceolatum]|uniref:alpha-amylase 1-like n=1 Tax=Branchiostoma lanceolatum TaxID=7740 RepID=UPI00345512FD